MSKDKDIIASLKLLLFPRFTTIWDLFILSQKADIEIEEVTNNLTKLSKDIRKRLAQLTLSRIRPLLRRKNRRSYIYAEDIRFWLHSIYEIIIALRDLKRKDDARAIAFNFLSIYFFIITLYAIWRGAGPSNLVELMGKGEIERESINELLKVVQSERWRNLFSSINFSDAFNSLLIMYASSLKKMLEYSDKKIRETLYLELHPILNVVEKDDEIVNYYQRILEKKKLDPQFLRVFLSSIIMPLDALAKEFIIKHGEKSSDSLLKMVDMLSTFKDNSLRFNDLGLESIQTSIRIVKALLSNDLLKAIKELRSFGEKLMAEKKITIGVTERALLKIPPEIYSMPPPITPPPIELRDRLADASLLTTVNEVIEEVISSGLERKSLLRIPLIVKPAIFEKFLFHALSNPITSLALLFLIGVPIAFLLETSIILLDIDKGKIPNELITSLFKISYKLLLTTYNMTRYLEKKYGWKTTENRRLLSFYIYRDIFFTSTLLTHKIQEYLKTEKTGKKLLKVLQEVYRYLEGIHGKRLEKKEDISDLFV